jgi:hypothetical protein
MEVYKFRNCKQNAGQSLDEYVTELRKLSKDCEFTDVDKEILSQIIQNCRSNRLRRRALREPDMNLKTLLDLGRALEVAESQAQTMEAQNERNGVNAVRKPPGKQRNYNPKNKEQVPKRETTGEKCLNCGRTHARTSVCPAQGQECRYCKKPNHFERMCRAKNLASRPQKKSKRVHEVDFRCDTDSSD